MFELFLDREAMMYSSAYYETGEESLERAQHIRLERICDSLELGPSDHLLEIGTGWGGMAVHAASTPRLPGDDHDDLPRAARVRARRG